MSKNLSESEEEYLESLYRLSGGKERVRVGKLAKDLKIKEPSVVGMLKKLDRKNLVDYKSYTGASLTKKGEETGMRVTRRHRLAERLLCDVLGRDLPSIHEEACKLEHSITDETANEISRVLENPRTCPHGQPIPTPEEEDRGELIKLTEGEEGEKYKVRTIPEEKEDIQRLLPLGILPGTEIELVDNPSFSALMIKRGGDKLALSRGIASKIMVEKYGKRKHRYRYRSGG